MRACPLNHTSTCWPSLRPPSPRSPCLLRSAPTPSQFMSVHLDAFVIPAFGLQLSFLTLCPLCPHRARQRFPSLCPRPPSPACVAGLQDFFPGGIFRAAPGFSGQRKDKFSYPDTICTHPWLSSRDARPVSSEELSEISLPQPCPLISPH